MGRSINLRNHPVFNLWYTSFVCLFLLNQWLIYNDKTHWLLTSYLDDFLVLLIILPFTLWIMRWFLQKPKFLLDKEMILTAFLLVSLVFEAFLPTISKQYTRDYFDLVCYATSALGYYVYQQFYINKC